MDFAIDYVIIPFIKIGVVFAALSGVIAYLTLLERKVIAFMQVRLGPMRVAPRFASAHCRRPEVDAQGRHCP